MTDERMGDALLPSIAALPKASGVIFRHYSLTDSQRRALFDQVRKIARARRLLLILAGSPRLARAWKADGTHGRGRGWGVQSAPVHTPQEMRTAERNGADILFISPVFPTQSHIGKAGLGRVRLGLLMAGTKKPVIALGGMNPKRAQSLLALNIHGWAGIDALRVAQNIRI
jgi:thiamine-phosphate pyrophosphorylase